MASIQKENGMKITGEYAKNANGSLYHGKDKFENIFNVVENIMFEKS
jgi:hypothetical protein